MVPEGSHGPRGYGPRVLWYTLPSVLTSSGGHQSGGYTTYWNVFLLSISGTWSWLTLSGTELTLTPDVSVLQVLRTGSPCLAPS